MKKMISALVAIAILFTVASAPLAESLSTEISATVENSFTWTVPESATLTASNRNTSGTIDITVMPCLDADHAVRITAADTVTMTNTSNSAKTYNCTVKFGDVNASTGVAVTDSECVEGTATVTATVSGNCSSVGTYAGTVTFTAVIEEK